MDKLPPSVQNVSRSRLMNVRRLVAYDIVLHGPRFILIEFGVGVPALIALGVFVVTRAPTLDGGHISALSIALGAYFLSLALNYAPLLVHAVDLARKGSAAAEMGSELADSGRAARRYGLQQLLLIVPLFVFVLAIVQAIRGQN